MAGSHGGARSNARPPSKPAMAVNRGAPHGSTVVPREYGRINGGPYVAIANGRKRVIPAAE